MINKLITTALNEVGYLEKTSNKDLDSKAANAGKNNFTKYGKWYDEYYKISGFTGTYWCHMFVSWCAMTSDISSEFVPYTASCPTGASWFKQRGLWHGRAGYVPQRGDIIYFSYDGSGVDHVGIVERIDTSRVYTIEGNTSGGSLLIDNGGCVAQKSYSQDYSCILGYGVPKYIQLEDEDMTQEQFNKMMDTYLAERNKQPESEWSKKEGAFATAKNRKIMDGTSPQGFVTREQLAAVISRNDSIK